MDVNNHIVSVISGSSGVMLGRQQSICLSALRCHSLGPRSQERCRKEGRGGEMGWDGMGEESPLP